MTKEKRGLFCLEALFAGSTGYIEQLSAGYPRHTHTRIEHYNVMSFPLLVVSDASLS